MPDYPNSNQTGRQWLAPSLPVLLWLSHSLICDAQTTNAPVAPAPIGSPFVPVGPVANPFGQPPMAIGPAPAPMGYPFVNPYYGAPLSSAPVIMGPPVYGFSPPAYSVPAPYAAPYQQPLPYAVRRPTPFEGQADPLSPPVRPYEAQYQSGPSGSIGTVPMGPASAGPLGVPSAAIGNVRLTVSESFLNRLITREEQRPGEVRDVILGAQVTGYQTTNTHLKLDLVPSSDTIRGYLVLHGMTNSQTVGVTPQAMIDTASQQHFYATKEVVFDGIALGTRHAVVHVQARNQTLGARTPLTGTLFGDFADRIAYRAAQRKQPEAEAIARDRVAERVFPEFDSEVDKNLAKANEQLEGTVRKALRKSNLMPSQQLASSTDTSMTYSAQIGPKSATMSSPRLQNLSRGDASICLMLHESLLNNLISIIGLKGLKTTDKQIKAYFAPFEYKPDGDELDKAQPPIVIPGLTNLTTDIEFDENDPLTIQFDSDVTLVTLRAHFKPNGQKMVPPLAVKIEYRVDLIGEKLVVTPGKVQVSVLNSDDADSVPSLTLTVLKQAVESSLTRLAFERTLPAALWSFGGPVPKVTAVHSENGWAALTIE